MTKPTRLVSLALVALVAVGGVATDAFAARQLPPPRNTPSVPHSPDDIVCRVKDDNFYITNFGDRNLDSGRQVSWRSPTTGDEGVILLPKMLAPGEEVELYGVLSDFVAAGSLCTAELV
jgi:hypothetical protein